MRRGVALAGAARGRSGSPSGPLPRNDPSCPTFIDTDEIMSAENEEADMSSTIWRLGALLSSPRFGVSTLVAVMSLTLVMVTAACSSSTDSTENASGWRNFVAYSGVNPSQRVTAVPINSVDDMERIGGFPFVFPSYLPEGMSNKMTLGALVQAREAAGAEPLQRERIGILPESGDSPLIAIEEELANCNPPSCLDFRQVNSETNGQTIGDTKVTCETPTLFDDLPRLECDWRVGDKWFKASFQWTVDGATPTEEMRQEAMKVIKSMIVAPEHP